MAVKQDNDNNFVVTDEVQHNSRILGPWGIPQFEVATY